MFNLAIFYSKFWWVGGVRKFNCSLMAHHLKEKLRCHWSGFAEETLPSCDVQLEIEAHLKQWWCAVFSRVWQV